MPKVRRIAAELAGRGVIQITQGGQPVDALDELVGPVRLRRGPLFPSGPDGIDLGTEG